MRASINVNFESGAGVNCVADNYRTISLDMTCTNDITQ